MPALFIYGAVGLIKPELLQQREELRDACSVAADGVESSRDQKDREIAACFLDQLLTGCGVGESDQVMVERRAADEAAVRIVDVGADDAVVAGEPVERGAVRNFGEILIAGRQIPEERRLHARAAGELHDVGNLHAEERSGGRHVRGAADDSLVRLVILLDHIAGDDRAHAVAEEDQLRAAVIGLGVAQNIDRVGGNEFVAVFVSKMTELFELLIRAVSAMIVKEHVVAVRIQEVRERNVSLVVLRHAVQHDNRAFHFFGVRIIGINGSLVLVILCQHNSVDSHSSILRQYSGAAPLYSIYKNSSTQPVKLQSIHMQDFANREYLK